MEDQPKPFKLKFHTKALKEWRKLDHDTQAAFKNKLTKLVNRTETPTPRNALSGFPDGYFKIKLRKKGYRLVYRRDEGELIVLVLAVGRRDRNTVYDAARERLLVK